MSNCKIKIYSIHNEIEVINTHEAYRGDEKDYCKIANEVFVDSAMNLAKLMLSDTSSGAIDIIYRELIYDITGKKYEEMSIDEWQDWNYKLFSVFSRIRNGEFHNYDKEND